MEALSLCSPSYPEGLRQLLESLNEFQIAAVNIGPGLSSLIGVPGCLAGDTTILCRRGRRVSTIPIALEELFLKFNGLPSRRRPWVNPDEPTYTYSLGSDGVSYLNRIEAVVFSGIKPCVRVSAEGGDSGWSLTCTEDHPFMLPDRSYAPAATLADPCRFRGHGADVLLLGSMRPVKGGGRKGQDRHVIIDTKYHPYGWLHVVRAVERMKNPTDYVYRRVPRARLVLEAAMNGVPYDEFVHLLKTDERASAKFRYLDPELQVHHRDEHKTNDVPENLLPMTCEAHSRLHGKTENFGVEYCKKVRVVAVEKVGDKPTFDIRMQGPDHNFAANCFFVHNSGKTRTIVARIARLAADGLDPNYILAMTFTRNAAFEMNERLKALGIETARVGTIHSVCRQIVAGETKLFDSYQLDERGRLKLELKKLLSDLRRDTRIPRTGVDREGVGRFIEACKAHGLCYVYGDPFGMNIRAEGIVGEEAKKWRAQTGLTARELCLVYTELEKRRASRGLYDFDDMLLWCWMQLTASEESRRRWRQRWSVVIVDEVQDSNPVQWDISRLLVGLDSCIPHVKELHEPPTIDEGLHNLMVGGDPSQSIYGWRSAEPNLFVQFSTHADVTQLVLPINYRSNVSICKVGTGLVRGKPWHLAGEIKAHRPEPAPGAVSVHRYPTPEEEASATIHRCMEIAQTSGFRSCAVLSRLSVGLNIAEIECIRNRVPYVKRASGSFFESSEIKDILAYLRVSSGFDPDGRWLRHIINRPFRYIGSAFIAESEAHSQQHGTSLIDAMLLLGDKVTYRQLNSIRELYSLLQKLNDIARKSEEMSDEATGEEDEPSLTAGPAKMIGVVLDTTDYIEEIRREEGLLSMDESKIVALSELQRIASLFKKVSEFLAYIDALIIAVRKAQRSGLRVRDEENKDALVLSTIHRAKGLEWSHVFLVDVAAGRFPHSKAQNMDEELRLLYVAETRAKETCVVSYSGADSSAREQDAEDEDESFSSQSWSRRKMKTRSPFIDLIRRQISLLEK